MKRSLLLIIILLFSIQAFNCKDPLYDNIRDLPEFQEILTEMETKFWENNERIKASLVENDLL
jgi:hypothetical protein